LGEGVGLVDFCGAAGAWPPPGADFWVGPCPSTPCIMEGAFWRLRKARLREVSINKMAAMAVNLARKGAAPVLPKTVWDDPPNAAPIPAPLPCCNNTIKIRAKHTTTWKINNMLVILPII